jgi:hypothetical protein
MKLSKQQYTIGTQVCLRQERSLFFFALVVLLYATTTQQTTSATTYNMYRADNGTATTEEHKDVMNSEWRLT